MTKILTTLVLLVAITLVWLWSEYNLVLTKPVIVDKPHIFEIKKGDNFSQITHNLRAQEIAINPIWFKLLAYQQKVTHKLKAGEYELQEGLTMPDILAVFVAGKARQYSITFPEGWSFKQILEKIEQNPHLAKTLENVDYQGIMLALNSEYKYPEGLFFPDTYFFDKNTIDLDILKTAYHKMQRVLKQEWKRREKNLPLKTAYEALILASIVEKETGAANERRKIAGVFIRRLRKGMLLQTDPTVIYGMGDSYKGNIRYKDLKQATAYNTYIIKGLPPTPIAMPGREAIYAAMHPEKGKSLYFVAKGNGAGRHIFSATLRAHNNAVNKYQRKR
ncbi:MAG: endolytic transglycosylase MltG [Methylococcales bacterium]